MTWVDWVVTPLVGAVIGWCTNWIAIKMLFRPRTEKRLFGRKLPFTPGLIPKERTRLAKALGGTLGANVLTPDVLAGAIASPAVKEKIGEVLHKGFTTLAQSEETPDAWLGKLLGAEKDNILDRAEAFILDKLTDVLDSAPVRDGFHAFVSAKLDDLPALTKPLWNRGDVKTLALEKGLAFVQNESFVSMLQGFVQDAFTGLSAQERTLGSLLPPHTADTLKTVLADKTPDLVAYFTDLPNRHPDLDEALRTMTAQIAEQNFGRFIGLFVRYDTIYDNIKDKLFAYLAVPENQTGLRDKVEEWADGLLAQDVKTLLSRLPDDTREALTARLAGLLQNEINETQVTRAVDFLADKAHSLDLRDFLPESWTDKAAEAVYGLLRNELLAAVPGFVHGLRKKLAAVTVSTLLARIPAERAEQLTVRLADGAFVLVQKAVPLLVDALDVARLVEDKLNTFSTEEAEALVLGVVKKELSAITNLGALLGLVIGVVPLLLNLIR